MAAASDRGGVKVIYLPLNDAQRGGGGYRERPPGGMWRDVRTLHISTYKPSTLSLPTLSPFKNFQELSELLELRAVQVALPVNLVHLTWYQAENKHWLRSQSIF